MIDNGKFIEKHKFVDALHEQEIICRQLDKFLDNYDIILTLGTSNSAPPREIQELPDPSLIWTLSHVPAITAPAFRCPEGLPFGPQFISRRWNDYLLLQGIEELIDREILPSGSQKVINTDPDSF